MSKRKVQEDIVAKFEQVDIIGMAKVFASIRNKKYEETNSGYVFDLDKFDLHELRELKNFIDRIIFEKNDERERHEKLTKFRAEMVGRQTKIEYPESDESFNFSDEDEKGFSEEFENYGDDVFDYDD